MSFKVESKEDLNNFKGTVIRKPNNGRWILATDAKYKYYGITTSPSIDTLLENGKAISVKVKLPIIKVNLDTFEISADSYGTMIVKNKDGAPETTPIALNLSLSNMSTICMADKLEDNFKATLKERGIWVVE